MHVCGGEIQISPDILRQLGCYFVSAKSSTTYTAGYQNASARPAGQTSNKTYNYPAAGAAQSYTYPNQAAAAAATANKSECCPAHP